MRLTVDPNGERHGELSLSPVKLTGFKILVNARRRRLPDAS
jgi:hypothetical protein